VSAHSKAPKTRRALLSVSDKTGLVDFARFLSDSGWELISTGGTAKALSEAKIPVIPVEDITKFPECLGGRVKTLHPMIAGGILFKRDDKTHQKEAVDLGMEPIDLVVVNLYPFAETVEKMKLIPSPDSPLPDAAIEQIDIGGPSLLRSAAKNHASVTVICDPTDYEKVMNEMKSGDVAIELKRALAAKVFEHTAAYDSLIAEHMSGGASKGVMMTKGRTLRYGENPHQKGLFYEFAGTKNLPWKQLQGKELSYLNILDADGAWRMACDFMDPTAVFVKHANPSGIASAKTIEDAFQKGYDSDRLSAFGVIIALNKNCTEEIAKKIIDQKIFTEVLLAPSFDEKCLELMKQKPNIRVIEMAKDAAAVPLLYRSAFGGMLVQDDDLKQITEADLTFVTDKKPTKEQIRDLLFAWKVVKHAKSNAIVLAKDGVTVGIGCGQTSRVDSTWIAVKRAGDKAKGSVLASDAFFPFPDAVEEAAKNGIAAMIHPGGSVRDTEVFARANELGIAMVTTGVRAFRH
jgi:phosphoribosylaminoimidazolecarboxamide formyltransferase/IMP cyclohydrolase